MQAMSNYRGPETAEIYSTSEIYFSFPRPKKFVAARYPNLKLFQCFYAGHARDG